ncbi:hypothetical protein BB560_001232 [Smittium megazygosporum]|uniref:Uncharacterized protein n=1 Tax=Smittium megazygosporum TaxID=133381 RepID=A0A2T9ZI60_9FUNG|nr:hypothetical protein BB560_001232 [Smittium megazygosporum]
MAGRKEVSGNGEMYSSKINTEPNPTINILADVDSIFYLEPVKSSIENKIFRILRENSTPSNDYKGPEFENIEKLELQKKLKLEDFQNLIPANDKLIKSALQNTPALYFPKAGSYRILAKSYLTEVLEFILATSIVSDWDIKRLSHKKCTLALIEDSGSMGKESSKELESVVGCILKKFGNQLDTEHHMINGCKEKKWLLYDFISTLKRSVPPMFADMIPKSSLIDPERLYASVLRGLLVVRYEKTLYSPTELPTVSYFDKSQMGDEVLERFVNIFALKASWEYNEIIQYLEDLDGYSGFVSFFSSSDVLGLDSELYMGNSVVDKITGRHIEFTTDSAIKRTVDTWLSKYTTQKVSEKGPYYIGNSHLKYASKIEK